MVYALLEARRLTLFLKAQLKSEAVLKQQLAAELTRIQKERVRVEAPLKAEIERLTKAKGWMCTLSVLDYPASADVSRSNSSSGNSHSGDGGDRD